MKAITLFSGGKDSFLSTMIAMEHGYDILYGITIIPDEYSMMFHYPNSGISKYPASLLNFEIKYIKEKNFENYIKNIDNVDAIITGAIASDYQKTRIEKLVYSEKTIVFSPLWRKKQEYILEELLLRNIKAMIVSVSAEGFSENDLGKTIDYKYFDHLKEIYKMYRINIAGEGGEYESFVYGLNKDEIKIKNKNIIWKNSGGYLILDI